MRHSQAGGGHGGSGGQGTGTTSGTDRGHGRRELGTTAGLGTTSSGAGGAGSCSPDPLHTGLTATQTGISVDAFDCQVLKWAAFYKEPDPMIFKAIIYVESRFDDTSVACPNLPCGTPTGWTTAESGCYGLMQVVPACGDDPGGVGLLPNGQPNLTTDPTAAGWAGSISTPTSTSRRASPASRATAPRSRSSFRLTVDQYTMMAVGNYNSYGSTQSCTVVNTAYDDPVKAAYQQYAAAAGYPAHGY